MQNMNPNTCASVTQNLGLPPISEAKARAAVPTIKSDKIRMIVFIAVFLVPPAAGPGAVVKL